MRISTFVQPDGTKTIHNSPRQEGTAMYITGSGDDIENGTIGNGTDMIITNPDGEDYVSVSCQFLDDIYIKDGYIIWQNAVIGDSLSMEIVLPAYAVITSDDMTGNAAYNDDGDLEIITDSEIPDETWIGTHLTFSQDVVFSRFVNDINILGDNTVGLILESSDSALVKKELIYKFILKSKTNNADIVASIAIEAYRERTS